MNTLIITVFAVAALILSRIALRMGNKTSAADEARARAEQRRRDAQHKNVVPPVHNNNVLEFTASSIELDDIYDGRGALSFSQTATIDAIFSKGPLVERVNCWGEKILR